MRVRSILWVLLLLGVCGVGSYSQEFSDGDPVDARPVYVPLSRISYLQGGTRTNFQSFPVSRLTPEERRELDSAIGKLPKFAGYFFSGCHDRSQASYQLLSAGLRNKAYKVWVFSPERHTSSISGRIRLKSDDEFGKQVAWGYHVALLFVDGEKRLVLDQGLAQGSLITIDQWFAKMSIPAGSFWTVTNGNIYLFNSTVDLMSPNQSNPANQDLFNGYFFNYVSDQNKYLSRNLARDDAASQVMTQSACPELKPLLTKPGDLGVRLRSGQLPPSCQTLAELYNERVRFWQGLLEP